MKAIKIIGIDEGDPHTGYSKIYLRLVGTNIYGTIKYDDVSKEGFQFTLDATIRDIREKEAKDGTL